MEKLPQVHHAFHYGMSKQNFLQFNTLDLIAKNPQMAREREEISPPVRIHPFKAHLIIYQIEQNGAILVIRIRNAFEDWISDPL